MQRVDGVEVFNSDTTGAVNANNEVIAVAGQFFHGAAASGAARARASRSARCDGRRRERRSGVEGSDRPGGIRSDECRRTRQAISSAAPDQAGRRPVPVLRLHRGRRRRPARVRASRPRQGRDVPARRRAVRPRLLHGALDQGVPGVQLRHGRGRHARPALPQEPHLARRRSSIACTTPATRLFRPHDGPAPGTPHPTGVPNGFQAPTGRGKAHRRSKACWPAIPGCRPARRRPTATTASPTPTSRRRTDSAPGDVMGKVSGARRVRLHLQPQQAGKRPDNLQNSLVGMFFHVNWLHDRWYEAGFDEASGNAQKSNFGRGGMGGDPDAGRRQRLQRHRQRQHVDAGRRRQPAHADVRVHRRRSPTPDEQPRGAHHVPRDGALHHQPARRQRQRPDQRAGRSDGRRLGRLLRHLHDVAGDRQLRQGRVRRRRLDRPRAGLQGQLLLLDPPLSRTRRT